MGHPDFIKEFSDLLRSGNLNLLFCSLGQGCVIRNGNAVFIQYLFVKDMVAGRGYMALAAMIFGGWNPAGSFFASLLFAFAQAIRINLTLDIPEQFVQMLPYLLTLLVLMGVGRKVKGPQASGKIID